MACSILESVLKGCEVSNAGGINNLYVNDSSNITSFSASASTHQVTGLTASPDFVTFEFNREVGNAITSPKIDFVAGSTYFENTVTMVLARREASKSRALQVLGEGQRFLDLIVKDANDIYWYYENMQLSAGDEDSGTAYADGSKYTVTFIGKSTHRPYQISQALVEGVIS
jgi:hypothetical protein